jgi:gluconate 2-dehydrogenase alpha chain
MAIRLKKTDVVVVGLGAVGGVAVLPLARTGLKVIGLEAGPRISLRDMPSDEIRLSIRNGNGLKNNREIPTVRRSSSEVAVPGREFGNMANSVGGNSLHYCSQSWRLNPWIYKIRSETIKRYGEGALPKGTTVEDWPFGAETLEPFHDKVERAIGVAGEAANLRGRLTGRGNVFEAPRRREYPMPPLRRMGYHGLLIDAANRLGWHPFPAPSAVNSVAGYGGRPVCTYCGFCSGIGCHSGAKGSTDLTTVPAAERTGNLKVVPNARVTRITVDREGKASGVVYLKGRREYFQPASVVLLAAYAYEITRLLLLSKSTAYPNGLSNNHGQVGLHFFTHAGPSVTGLFPGRQLNRWTGQGSQAIHVDDFDADNFDHTGLGFIGGGSMDGRGDAKPIGLIRGATPPGVPRWGSAWKAWIHENANSMGTIGSGGGTDTLPYEQLYLDLDPTHRDSLGFPVIRVTYDYTDNENRMHAFILAKQRQWLLEMGASVTWGTLPVANPVSVHAYGGARMGDDPDRNVVDRWGMSHEVPNVGVLGGAVMGSSGGHNPTQTVQALAWRTSEHIVKNWKSIGG